MIKKVILITGLLVFAGLSALFAQPRYADNTCPVMPGTRLNEKFYVDYQGKRVFLCCRSCVRAFKKNPERYAAKLS